MYDKLLIPNRDIKHGVMVLMLEDKAYHEMDLHYPRFVVCLLKTAGIQLERAAISQKQLFNALCNLLEYIVFMKNIHHFQKCNKWRDDGPI